MTKRKHSLNFLNKLQGYLTVTAHQKKQNLTIPASTEFLSEARDFVANYAEKMGFGADAIEQVRMAVDEACTNVIKHAYQYDSNKHLQIQVDQKKNEMWVSITDEGIAFDPSKYTEPDLEKRIKERRGGGFGIYLIKKFMDSVEYRKTGASNELKMSKKI